MLVTIIREDGIVGVDRVFRSVDLSGLAFNIHAVQWDGVKGHIEYKDGTRNKKLISIEDYQSYIDAWIAAAPPPLTLNELKIVKRQEFITEGVSRIADVIPEWDSYQNIAMLASIWNMLGTPNANQTLGKNIYLYVKNTVPPKINAAADQAALDAIDPTAADPFGDGAVWPT